MATIKAGVIFIWTGTHAGIPAGWNRVTALDGYFTKGTAAGTNPATTGGASTHSHNTTATHTHTANAHTHTITVGNGSGGTTTGSGSNTAVYNHNHANFTSGAVSGFTCDNISATYSSVSNNPPYYEVIFITPASDIADGAIPAGLVALADAAAPAGFYVCDGNNSTPNLVGKYLKGAAASGNAGGTGGSTQNVHTLTHTHSTSHSHAAATSGNQSDSSCDSRATTANPASQTTPHTHSIAMGSQTVSVDDNPSLTTSETVEPAYTKLLAMYNSADSVIPKGAIGMWLGTLANIPAGWKLCDGTNAPVDMRGRHLKITATVGEIGNTGGSNTHTHASQNHTHTKAHSGHTASVTHGGARGFKGSGKTATNANTSHFCTVNSINLVLADASTAGDEQNNEPSYTTVAFIKLSGNEYTKSLTENIDFSTRLSRKPTKVKRETVNITERRVKKPVRSIKETAEYSETLATPIGYFLAKIENIKITEIKIRKVTKALIENITESEVFRSKATLIRSFSENIGITEVFKKVSVEYKNLVESIVFSEVFIKKGIKNLIENIGITESFSKVATLIKSLTETIAVTEVFTVFRDFKKYFTENIKITESFSRVGTFIRTFTENIKITERKLTIKEYIRNFTENISITETFSRIKTMFIVLSENIKITEVFVKTLRQFAHHLIGKISSMEIIGKTKKMYIRGKIKSDDIIGKIKRL